MPINNNNPLPPLWIDEDSENWLRKRHCLTSNLEKKPWHIRLFLTFSLIQVNDLSVQDSMYEFVNLAILICFLGLLYLMSDSGPTGYIDSSRTWFNSPQKTQDSDTKTGSERSTRNSSVQKFSRYRYEIHTQYVSCNYIDTHVSIMTHEEFEAYHNVRSCRSGAQHGKC